VRVDAVEKWPTEKKKMATTSTQFPVRDWQRGLPVKEWTIYDGLFCR
jgi:hypothetical protein